MLSLLKGQTVGDDVGGVDPFLYDHPVNFGHELKVSRAVRISSSMPFFFDPIKARRNPVEYLIDGGVLSNFPVWIFDQDPPHGIPTFGFSLSGGKDKEKRYHKIRTPISMGRSWTRSRKGRFYKKFSVTKYFNGSSS